MLTSRSDCGDDRSQKHSPRQTRGAREEHLTELQPQPRSGVDGHPYGQTPDRP